MKKRSAVLLIFLITAGPVFSQTLIWKNYSSMYDINGVTVAGGKVWAATTGGVFSYSPATGAFAEYTTTEGLSNIKATAITADSGAYILVGESDGSIDELDLSGRVVRSQHDIANSSATDKQVTALSVEGDTIFACTPFGVVLISRSTFRTLDTYSHFDPGQGSIQANGVAVFSGRIFVANQFGLSYAPQSAVNLAAPDLWHLSDTLGLGSGVNTITVSGGSLYVGTQQGLYYTTDGLNFQEYPGSLTSISSLATGSNFVLVNSTGGLYKAGPGGSLSAFLTGGTQLNAAAAISDTLAACATSEGLLIVGSSVNRLFPPGPATNVVSDLAVDSSGNLWCSTSRTFDAGVALMKFNGTTWENLNISNNSQLFTDNYYKVSAVGSDEIVAGAWGGPQTTYRGGIAIINGDSIKVFSSPNSTLVGEPGDVTYVIGGGAAADASGDIWMTNPLSYANNPIVAYSPQDNKWYSFHNSLSPVSAFVPIAVDGFGGVWAGDQYGQASLAGSYSGLFYYNANGTLSNTLDDRSYIFTQENSGLLSNHINALLVDSENQVWIGTDLGMDVIYTPDPSSSFYVQPIYSLLDQNINDIDYDALDQKWVATNTGVYVISRDGNMPIASYNVTNSPLPDNQVLAVACDRTHGIVYFATQYGVTELKAGVFQPLQSFSKLKIFPDPALLPVSQPIHIEGLVANSEIKIFTIDGRMVDSFQAQGGNVAYWNGMDQSGELLPSGIYVVVAYASDGSQSTVAKIALIRK